MGDLGGDDGTGPEGHWLLPTGWSHCLGLCGGNGQNGALGLSAAGRDWVWLGAGYLGEEVQGQGHVSLSRSEISEVLPPCWGLVRDGGVGLLRVFTD